MHVLYLHLDLLPLHLWHECRSYVVRSPSSVGPAVVGDLPTFEDVGARTASILPLALISYSLDGLVQSRQELPSETLCKCE